MTKYSLAVLLLNSLTSDTGAAIALIGARIARAVAANMVLSVIVDILIPFRLMKLTQRFDFLDSS
jgi:hypothetical protein